MQQTQNYKLNKPETTDPFTPAPLNENADKLEAALAGLDGRVTVLEGRKIVMGTYTGNGSTQMIELGFTPAAVLLQHGSMEHFAMATAGQSFGGSSPYLSIVPNGFQVVNKPLYLNDGGRIYIFIAIA